MAERLRQDALPSGWSYGVMRDGRIFFINEVTNETNWLHPFTGKAVGTGFKDRNDLPQGWQEGFTPSGRAYYVDHLNETTTFYHPLTGKSDMDEEYPDHSESNTSETGSQKAPSFPLGPKKDTKKIQKARSPSVKRNPNSVKVKEGWLQKRDHGKIAVWRKRWCILSDFCLFYYKDPTDPTHVGSIMLPGYNVYPVGPKDKGTKKFAFKCEHGNMRTYYFAGSTQEDMESWMSALHAASKMEIDDQQRKPSQRDEEEWGRPSSTLPLVRTSNGTPMSSNDTYSRVHPGPPMERRHSLGDDDRPASRQREYEEVPRKVPPRNAGHYADPRDRQPPRPRSAGPGSYPTDESLISRSKSLPRQSAPPPQRTTQQRRDHAHDPYATMPRNRDGRPVSGPVPTYVDPREIQFRKRQQRNAQPPPEDRRRSEPPRRPPYPNGYEVDRNANYAKSPQAFQQQKSPMQQSPPLLRQPEQRNGPHSPRSYDRTPPVDRRAQTIERSNPMDRQRSFQEPAWRNGPNSPRSYNGTPPIDRRAQTIDRSNPGDRQRSLQEERIPVPQVQAEVQMSAPDLRSSPRSPQSRDGRDSADMAPTRVRPPVSRNSTLREEQGGDQLAPLAPMLSRNRPDHRAGLGPRPEQNQPNRAHQPGGTTDRFRKWQQKTQPYILLSTGIRLRLSIAANDLLGKSHEELVLFLIQLRRDKANMEEWLAMIDNELEVLQSTPGYSNGGQQMLRSRHSDSLRRSNSNLNEDDLYEGELRLERDEVSKELEVGLPLINLVDNLVRKGSLYGGQNELIAHEFYKNQLQGNDVPAVAPKLMVEYSRQQEEEKLMNGIEEDHRKIMTAEDRELDEKLRRLRELDQKMQEISSTVYVLKEEKDKLEQSLERLRQQYDREWENKQAQDKIEEQQIRLDRDLIRVRSHLAQGTKDLEDITVENSKLEHEIALLRMERERQEPTENGYYPGARELMEISDEVSNVDNKMTALDQKREQLMAQMAGFRKEPSNGYMAPGSAPGQPNQSFQSTDLDSEVSWDISGDHFTPDRPPQPSPGRPHDLPLQGQEESPLVARSQHQVHFAAPPSHSPIPPSPMGSRGPPSQYSTLERTPSREGHFVSQGQPMPPSPMGSRGPPSQYSTLERTPSREGHSMTPDAARGIPTEPGRTYSDPRGIPNQRHPQDGYGYGGSPQGRTGRSPSDQRPRSAGHEMVIQPQQVQVAHSQPPRDGQGQQPRMGGYNDPRDDRPPPQGYGDPRDGRQGYNDPRNQRPAQTTQGPQFQGFSSPRDQREWPSQGELRSPSSSRQSSNRPVYKVTDLDTRRTYDISEVDIVRSPVEDRPLLSPGEVLPRLDPSRHAHQGGGPPSFSETPSDSEVAELTRNSTEGYPYSGPTQHPPPPIRGTDSYQRVKDARAQPTQEKGGGGKARHPLSYEYHYSGFKPRTDRPRSRDSDTESTSSSIRNTAVYGPAPFRRGVEPDIRKQPRGPDGQKIHAAQVISHTRPSTHSQPPAYKQPGYKRYEPALEREAASDTEAIRPPPEQQNNRGRPKKDSNQSYDDIDIGNIERALKAAEAETAPPRSEGVIKSSLKNVEVDESTSGGLRHEEERYVYDLNVIYDDRELGMPGKIVIPERYNPAEDEDIEDTSQLTEEEKAAREERAGNIAKMLSAHSMQSWHPSEIDPQWLREGAHSPEDIHSRVEEEKQLRRETLARTRALAEEVKQHSLQRGQQREGSDGIHPHSAEPWSSEEER